MASPHVISLTRDQLTVLQIDGSQARVSAAVQGAHLYDWSPHGTAPVLFLSRHSGFKSGKAIRGGVPLCFPWFGPKADDSAAPQHGFARTRDWMVELAEVARDGSARLVFSLSADERTRAAWPHEFAARFSITAGRELALALEVRNTGRNPLSFGAALHTYLAVSDVRQISLGGLENTAYLDKVGGGSVPRCEGAEPIRFSGETDRVYIDTTSPCVVDDPVWRRRIHVAKSGSRSTVVWNPWTGKARAMADLGEESWPGFVCVETCNAGDDTVTISPGASHTLATQISVEQA